MFEPGYRHQNDTFLLSLFIYPLDCVKRKQTFGALQKQTEMKRFYKKKTFFLMTKKNSLIDNLINYRAHLCI